MRLFTARDINRREFLAQSAALGGVLAAIAAAPGPLRDLLGTDAVAQSSGLSPDNLRTFVAAVEAICSFDGKSPPPSSVNGRAQPSAADAGARFAGEYANQYAGFRQLVDIVLPVAEIAPRTPPPTGAVTMEDFVAYGERPFSELEIPLRLRFVRSWLADHNSSPLDPQNRVAGIADVGTLHRAIAVAALQLTTFFYYQDPRTWQSVGWHGPLIGPGFKPDRVDFGEQVARW